MQSMDITSIKAVLKELSELIVPSRFENAQQTEKSTVQLAFRTIKSLIWIELSWSAEMPRLVQINSPRRYGDQSTLARQLKNVLKGMALVEIHQSGFERIVEFHLSSRPGIKAEKNLIIEIMGRHSNLILKESNNKIITLGRQVRHHQSRVRPLSTGDIYIAPPPLRTKKPSSEETFEQWSKNIKLVPHNLKKSLQSTYQGTSPSLCMQLADYQESIASKMLISPVNKLTNVELTKLHRNWKVIKLLILS